MDLGCASASRPTTTNLDKPQHRHRQRQTPTTTTTPIARPLTTAHRPTSDQRQHARSRATTGSASDTGVDALGYWTGQQEHGLMGRILTANACPGLLHRGIDTNTDRLRNFWSGQQQFRHFTNKPGHPQRSTTPPTPPTFDILRRHTDIRHSTNDWKWSARAWKQWAGTLVDDGRNAQRGRRLLWCRLRIVSSVRAGKVSSNRGKSFSLSSVSFIISISFSCLPLTWPFPVSFFRRRLSLGVQGTARGGRGLMDCWIWTCQHVPSRRPRTYDARWSTTLPGSDTTSSWNRQTSDLAAPSGLVVTSPLLSGSRRSIVVEVRHHLRPLLWQTSVLAASCRPWVVFRPALFPGPTPRCPLLRLTSELAAPAGLDDASPQVSSSFLFGTTPSIASTTSELVASAGLGDASSSSNPTSLRPMLRQRVNSLLLPASVMLDRGSRGRVVFVVVVDAFQELQLGHASSWFRDRKSVV